MPLTPALAKLTMPRVGQIHSRVRLLELCDQLIGKHKLIWIAAPAGSGKTTFVADFFANRQRNHLWYQIDAGDQDIASFFNFLANAVEREHRLKRKLVRFTPEYTLGLPVFSRNFFRSLFGRLKVPANVVFDNYQEVSNSSEFNTALVEAVEELPDGVGIVVISRVELPAAFARHKANGWAAEIGAAELSTTADEDAAIARLTLGANRLNAADLARLRQATHGWMAGLILALREIGACEVGTEFDVIEAISHAPAQDPARFFDYFASEVFARLDPVTRNFLYAASLFPVMTAGQCEKLTGNRESKPILQRLVRENFFTSRRGLMTASYEFHPLFRQFLLAQGEEHLEPERLASLTRSAGQLLAKEGETEQAASLMTKVGDWSALAELVRRHGSEMEKQGRLATLRKWIAALPAAERAGNPWLLYWQGVTELPTEPVDAYESFSRAYAIFRERDEVDGRYRSWIGVVSALFFRHDDMSPTRYWIEELEQLRRQHPKRTDLEINARVMMAAIGILILGDPSHPSLGDWIKQAEKIYRFVPIDTLRCVVGAQLGMYYTFFGHIDKLAVLAEQLKPLASSKSVPDIARFLVQAVLIFKGWATATPETTNNAIEESQKLLKSTGAYVAAQWFLGVGTMAKCVSGEIEQSRQLQEQYQQSTNPRHRMEMMMRDYMNCWYALMSGDYNTALIHIETALELIRACHQSFIEAQALGGLVQALIGLGRYPEAQEQLQQLRVVAGELPKDLYVEFYSNFLEAYLHDQAGGNTQRVFESLRQGFVVAIKNNWNTMMFLQPRLITRLCVLSLQHNIEPEYAKHLIRLNRLMPPTQGELIEQWPWPVRIYTLGRFTVTNIDESLRPESMAARKPLELLQALIAFGGREVSQQKLAEALWTDAEADAAQTAFKTTLHRLRRLLGDDDALVLKDGKLSLNTQLVWVDVWSLERQMTELETLLSTGRIEQIFEQRRKSILSLYRGPFLANEPESAWMLPLRERLRSRFLRTLTALGRRYEFHQQHEHAVRCYQQGIEIDVLAEDFYRGVMRSHHAQGRHAEALATYRRCRDTIGHVLGVEPSNETELLRRRIEAVQL